MAGPARGKVLVNKEECKGCGLCVESCPPKCLELLPELNAYGVHPAHYKGSECTGCGIFVRATLQSSRRPFLRDAGPITGIRSHRRARSQKRRRCTCRKSAERSC